MSGRVRQAVADGDLDVAALCCWMKPQTRPLPGLRRHRVAEALPHVEHHAAVGPNDDGRCPGAWLRFLEAQ